MDLIAKLLEYQKYKIAAGILENIEDENVPFVARENQENLFLIEDKEDDNWKQLTVLDLLSAFAEIINKKEEGIGYEVTVFNYSVEDKIKNIKDLLANKESINYFEIINYSIHKYELVCTFLAILELVKTGLITVRQHKIFGDIHIVRRKVVVQE